MASDACGPLVWSTVSGDRNMFGDAKASATLAEAPRPRKLGRRTATCARLTRLPVLG